MWNYPVLRAGFTCVALLRPLPPPPPTQPVENQSPPSFWIIRELWVPYHQNSWDPSLFFLTQEAIIPLLTELCLANASAPCRKSSHLDFRRKCLLLLISPPPPHRPPIILPARNSCIWKGRFLFSTKKWGENFPGELFITIWAILTVVLSTSHLASEPISMDSIEKKIPRGRYQGNNWKTLPAGKLGKHPV